MTSEHAKANIQKMSLKQELVIEADEYNLVGWRIFAKMQWLECQQEVMSVG